MICELEGCDVGVTGRRFCSSAHRSKAWYLLHHEQELEKRREYYKANPESLPSTPCGHGSCVDEFNCSRRIPATNTSEALIKHMVNRFLGWSLPLAFQPDGGISFKSVSRFPPTGTNLFSATQAEAMIRYMLATPALQDEPENPNVCPTCNRSTWHSSNPCHDAWHGDRSPARPSAKRIEPLKPRVDIEGIEGPPTPREIFDKIQELITAHNESQGKQE